MTVTGTPPIAEILAVKREGHAWLVIASCPLCGQRTHRYQAGHTSEPPQLGAYAARCRHAPAGAQVLITWPGQDHTSTTTREGQP